MIKTGYYEVAGHRFSVTAGERLLALMTNYEPFVVADNGQDPLFSLTVNKAGRDGSESADALRLPPGFKEEMTQDDDGTVVISGHIAKSPVFVFRWDGLTAGWVVCSEDFREGSLYLTGNFVKPAIDNALMILYALATADRGTALFHSAVVSHNGRGFMFLGTSGIGKSTHARLWLKYIPDTELVNDDNPVVRDGVVYGSPWSGKTPCYRNVKYPVGGLVMLSQAPYNKIQPLKGIAAYVALVPSISGMRWNKRIADGLHATENAIASNIPMWHLDCLPDEEAARVCQGTIDS